MSSSITAPSNGGSKSSSKSWFSGVPLSIVLLAVGVALAILALVRQNRTLSQSLESLELQLTKQLTEEDVLKIIRADKLKRLHASNKPTSRFFTSGPTIPSPFSDYITPPGDCIAPDQVSASQKEGRHVPIVVAEDDRERCVFDNNDNFESRTKNRTEGSRTAVFANFFDPMNLFGGGGSVGLRPSANVQQTVRIVELPDVIDTAATITTKIDNIDNSTDTAQVQSTSLIPQDDQSSGVKSGSAAALEGGPPAPTPTPPVVAAAPAETEAARKS